MKSSSGIFQTCFNVRDTNDNPAECARDRIQQIARIAENKNISGALFFFRLTELINADFSLNIAGLKNAAEQISLFREDQDIIVAPKERWFKAKKKTHCYYPVAWNDNGNAVYLKYNNTAITIPAYWDKSLAIKIGDAYGRVINWLQERDSRVKTISISETSAPTPKGKGGAYCDGLIALMGAIRKKAPEIEIAHGPNFLENEKTLRRFLAYCNKIGNTVTVFSDTIKCRAVGEDRCGPGCGGYKIPAFDYLDDYPNIRRGGQFQTVDVHWANHEQDYKWAIEWGAEILIQQQPNYWTRDQRSEHRNSDPEWWSYCNELAAKYAIALKGKNKPVNPIDPITDPENEQITPSTEGNDMPDPFSLRPANYAPQKETLKFETNVFGFPMARITKPRVKNEKYPPEKYPHMRAHTYSTRQPFNDKHGYILTFEGTKGVSLLLDKNTGSYIKTVKHGLYGCFWLPDAVSDGVAYIFGTDQLTNKLIKYSIDTNERVEFDFFIPSVKGYKVGNTEGGITQSGKILYTKENGSYVDCILINFIAKTARRLRLSAPGGKLNTAGVSDSGKWIVAMFDSGKSKGIHAYEVNYNTIPLKPTRKLLNKSHHAVLAVDGNGRDMYIAGSVIKPGGSERYIIGYNLDTGKEIVLLGGNGEFTNSGTSGGRSKPGQSLACHVGRAPKGWVMVTFCSDVQGPHTAIFLKLDGSQTTIPVAYTYNPVFGGKNNYLLQSHGTASFDGKTAAIVAPVEGVRCMAIINTSSINFDISDKPDIKPISDPDDIIIEIDPPDVDPDPPEEPNDKAGRIALILAAMKKTLQQVMK